MIRYALKCKDGHSFESWFQSAEAYDKLAAAGMVSCAICGSDKVEKAIMAPRVRPGRNAVSKVGEAETPASVPASAPTPAEPPAPAAGALSSPSGDLEKAVKELRSHIDRKSVV